MKIEDLAIDGAQPRTVIQSRGRTWGGVDIIMPNMRRRRARSPEEPPTNGELRDALTMLAQVVANQVQQGAQAPRTTTPGGKGGRFHEDEPSGLPWFKGG
ncbi:hypothetical protein MTR67_052317 [Solanum verrucosum]|uniref:Uncharacterized protein n=1 Tax=Solanum verrucosum TaxID=315347 RepID=A0AAF0V6Q0_SOLVR|nr:hypothetical protein MTR67_052317 [Solanum verrucosum]